MKKLLSMLTLCILSTSILAKEIQLNLYYSGYPSQISWQERHSSPTNKTIASGTTTITLNDSLQAGEAAKKIFAKIGEVAHQSPNILGGSMEANHTGGGISTQEMINLTESRVTGRTLESLGITNGNNVIVDFWIK